MENRRRTGMEYERRAEEYLSDHGFLVLERNFRCKMGEIDLIGKQDGYLVFVEVKYRAKAAQGEPEEAVHRAKQKKICKTALWYCMCNGITEAQPLRFDVVAIHGEELRWIQNAFEFVR